MLIENQIKVKKKILIQNNKSTSNKLIMNKKRNQIGLQLIQNQYSFVLCSINIQMNVSEIVKADQTRRVMQLQYVWTNKLEGA